MDKRVSGCRGCLLGLAVGDAMGYSVDARSLAEIRSDYQYGISNEVLQGNKAKVGVKKGELLLIKCYK